MDIKTLRDLAAKEAFGRTEPSAPGLCISCNLPALPRCYSVAGIREYHLSGLCELCFDAGTKEEDDTRSQD